MNGSLYIVATPIGNLDDLTKRATEVLNKVDFILAEDTRVTLKLLNHVGVKKPIHSYTDYASLKKEEKIVEELKSGRSCALVSDAGTPAVSDPGAKLVDAALKAGVEVVPIPGASSVTALMSVFGRSIIHFHFWGFFPQKKTKQAKLVTHFMTLEGVHIFFESPYRIVKTLKLLQNHPELYLVVGREMTKKFETFYRGKAAEVVPAIEADGHRGEFCVGVMLNGI